MPFALTLGCFGLFDFLLWQTSIFAWFSFNTCWSLLMAFSTVCCSLWHNAYIRYISLLNCSSFSLMCLLCYMAQSASCFRTMRFFLWITLLALRLSIMFCLIKVSIDSLSMLLVIWSSYCCKWLILSLIFSTNWSAYCIFVCLYFS